MQQEGCLPVASLGSFSMGRWMPEAYFKHDSWHGCVHNGCTPAIEGLVFFGDDLLVKDAHALGRVGYPSFQISGSHVATILNYS